MLIEERVALRATLYEIALQTPDIARMADYYSSALGYSFTKTGETCLGRAAGRRLRLVSGSSGQLGHAAYALDSATDLEELKARLTAAGAIWAPTVLDGLAPDAIRVADPDGNVFVFGLVHHGADEISSSLTVDRSARIQHVVFASLDAPRLLAFYTGVLGFTLSDRVVDGEDGLRTAFVRCSQDHHSLAVFAASESRLDHHCYETSDWNMIRDWADHFAQLRIPLKWGPGRHGPGDNLFLFVHDPDGNWIEVSAELEQVLPDRPVGNWPHEERTLNSWGIGLLRS